MSDLVETSASYGTEFSEVQLSNSASIMRPVIESGLILLGLNFAETLMFEPGFYGQLGFHPFWIVILLAAMQYGIFGGVTAAGMACLLMDWPARPIGVDIAQHYIDLAVQPLHWLVVALLLGSYRQIQIWQESRLKREHVRLRDVNESLAEEITRMDSALAHAELALVTQTSDGSGKNTEAFNALLSLLYASESIEDLDRAFRSAATAATGLPSGLLITDASGSLTSASGSISIESVPVSKIAERYIAEGTGEDMRSTVVKLDTIIKGDPRHLVVSGVHAGHDTDIAGAVLLFAADEAGVMSAQPIAEMLAIAVSTALNSVDPGLLSEHQSNIRQLPAAQ